MPTTVRRNAVAKRSISAAATLALLALGGQAHADAPQRTGAQPAEMADVDQALRLETIGYQLARANAARCATPDMLTGLMLHNIGGYDESERAALTEAFGLSYGFGVLNVVPRSAAALGGIVEGDEILSVNGKDLAGFAQDSIGKDGSYDRTARFVALLDEALGAPTTLGIRRGALRISVQIQGEKGCSAKFAVLHRHSANAWSDGRYVAVTDRMMAKTADDSELAFVVAHEMSHNILRHAAQMRGASRLLMQFGLGAGKMKANEREADALAVELLASAGYDLAAPERLLKRSAQARWMDLPITHPGISSRIKIVRAAIDRIRLAQSQDRSQARPSPGISAPTAWLDENSGPDNSARHPVASISR